MHKQIGIKRIFMATLGAAAIALSGCASIGPETRVVLSGANEVPSVSTGATGFANFWVNSDKTVTGTMTTSGIDGRAAHIHVGLPGTNGPIAITLAQTSPGNWSVPAGSKFTQGQYQAYLGGETYVNVHSPAFPNGEIRGQLK